MLSELVVFPSILLFLIVFCTCIYKMQLQEQFEATIGIIRSVIWRRTDHAMTKRLTGQKRQIMVDKILHNTNHTTNRKWTHELARVSSSCSTSLLTVKRHEHHAIWKWCWTQVCVYKLILESHVILYMFWLAYKVEVICQCQIEVVQLRLSRNILKI